MFDTRIISILGLVTLSLLAKARSEEEECFLEPQATRLQMVFVLDATGTFDDFRNTNFPLVAKKIIAATEQKFKNSEYGIATFSDFPDGTRNPSLQDRSHDPNKDYCYYNHQPLTSNFKLFNQSSHHVPRLTSGQSESSLTGLLFAAADKTMGWHEGHIDKDGKTIQKVLVLVTDEFNSNTIGSTNGRLPAKGDGHDTCLTSLPPTFAVIQDTLHKEMMAVIGLLTNDSHSYADMFKEYNGYFKKMPLVRFKPYEADKSKVDELVKTLVDGIQESVRCEWADPPAYNTLGY